ncbi:MAG TPA: cytochrome b/b6 domain-containing protein [Dongiaceae bacterium]|jgi:cytochrome b|nr:cytochrome b/b6 domain-containing protein [Dongiaceae bacterium]
MTAAREHFDQDLAAGSIKIWDPVVRVFHWGFAAAVFIALMSDEDRALHEAAGYAALALILGRILWGFIGPRHARFSSFVRPPGAVLAYLKDAAGLRARRYLGHNPAGGSMILLLLAIVATAGISGWLSETDRFFGVAWVEDLHRASANALIALIAFHVGGVVFSSVMHGENLVRAMITGRKALAPAAEDERPPIR